MSARIDLSLVSDELIFAEAGRRQNALRATRGGGRPRVYRTCKACKAKLSAREMVAHKCPERAR